MRASRVRVCVMLQVGVLFGNPETTSGGQALKYYASMRLDIRSKEKITEAGRAEPVGNKVKVKVVKNKVRSLGTAPTPACVMDHCLCSSCVCYCRQSLVPATVCWWVCSVSC